MIDYSKIHNLSVNAEKLLNNDRLTFPLSNIATTGEFLNRWQVAQYKGLTFKIKGENVRLEFSPHKYFEGGKTNFQVIYLNKIQNVISEISTTFEFDPKKSAINFIEIGVNIKTNVDPNKLIDCFVCLKNNPFDRLPVKNKGYGRKCCSQQLDVKFYNKGLQNDLNYYLLRFEVKIKRIKYLERYGIKSLSLADLTKPEFYPIFKKILLDVFDDILMYNPEIAPDKFSNQKDRDLFLEGRYHGYWQKLERTKRHRQMKRFIELADGEKIKKRLRHLISEKCNELTTCDNNSFNKKLQRINRFEDTGVRTKLQRNNRFDKTEQIEKLQRNNISINGYNVAHCIVTGLLIHNQKPNTKYLSEKSIQCFFEHDPET